MGDLVFRHAVGRQFRHDVPDPDGQPLHDPAQFLEQVAVGDPCPGQVFIRCLLDVLDLHILGDLVPALADLAPHGPAPYRFVQCQHDFPVASGQMLQGVHSVQHVLGQDGILLPVHIDILDMVEIRPVHIDGPVGRGDGQGLAGGVIPDV